MNCENYRIYASSRGRSVIIGFCTTHKIPFIPHPYGMRSERNGFSHGLKKCPLDTFLHQCAHWCRPFESQYEENSGDHKCGHRNFGRSIGIRTRGLLDPKSPKVENPILYSPYRRIVSIILDFVYYLVQLVHTVLTYSGSRFGSGEVAAPPKSEHWELFSPFQIGRL